jgi:hypothetical protein
VNHYYSDCGKIVTGVRYIHRTDIEQQILNRIRGNRSASISIVGLPRMGKSTLVHHVLFHEKLSEKDIPILINVSVFNTAQDFFIGFISAVYDYFIENDLLSLEIKRKYENINTDQFLNFSKVQSFFKTISKNYHLIVGLDEFDHSRKLFKEFDVGFNWLRDLAYQPETNISFVFVSRRLVFDLEANIGSSTLSNILRDPIFVSSMTDLEIEQYFRVASTHASVSISKKDQDNLLQFAGNVPYWLDLLMMDYDANRLSIEQLINNKENFFYELFLNILNILEELQLLDKLYQIYQGPIINTTLMDLELLKKYGVISKNDEQQVSLISIGFKKFIDTNPKHIEIYPTLELFEKNLKKVIKQRMITRFRIGWEEQVLNEVFNPFKIKKIRARKDSRVNDLDKKYNQASVATISILDGCLLSELFDIISYYYNDFIDLFGGDKNEFFKSYVETINIGRNETQHFNYELLSNEFQGRFSRAVETLLDKLGKVK